ncbi:MAG: hypothetical protein ACO3J6_00690, partial [Opitutales bacterium]
MAFIAAFAFVFAIIGLLVVVGMWKTFDKAGQREGRLLEVERAGLYLGKIQQVVDDAQQRLRPERLARIDHLG